RLLLRGAACPPEEMRLGTSRATGRRRRKKEKRERWYATSRRVFRCRSFQPANWIPPTIYFVTLQNRLSNGAAHGAKVRLTMIEMANASFSRSAYPEMLSSIAGRNASWDKPRHLLRLRAHHMVLSSCFVISVAWDA